MAISRYSYVDTFFEGKTISNSDCVEVINEGMKNGTINFDVITLAGNQRLDVISGQFYGDSSLWWIIAAASGIGWSLQVPAGTIVKIPTNIQQIFTLL